VRVFIEIEREGGCVDGECTVLNGTLRFGEEENRLEALGPTGNSL
jgi:pseudouridine-5'-phosphate glycosidase